jgi:hypothetical protein
MLVGRFAPPEVATPPDERLPGVAAGHIAAAGRTAGAAAHSIAAAVAEVEPAARVPKIQAQSAPADPVGEALRRLKPRTLSPDRRSKGSLFSKGERRGRIADISS